MTQKMTFPRLAGIGHITGRPANRDDVNAGNAAFNAEINGESVGEPMSITVPQYAYWLKNGEAIPVVIIQAEQCQGKRMFGALLSSGAHCVGLAPEFQLLGTDLGVAQATSPRSNAMPTIEDIRPEFNLLTQAIFLSAERLLSINGRFAPFGVLLKQGGEVVEQMTKQPESPDQPINQDVIRPVLDAIVSARARDLVAFGICDLVTVQNQQRRELPAIQVIFEHIDGVSLRIIRPFEAKQDGTLTFLPSSVRPDRATGLGWLPPNMP